MDRDAAATDVVPPIAWETTRRVAVTGLGLVAAAAVLGLMATALGEVPSLVHTARLFLVLIGAILAGLAVSFRPDLVQPWLLGAGTALLAVAGTPAHWDSFRLLFAVLTGLALLRAAFTIVSPRVRLAVVSAFILLHFYGILLATTSPNPEPWMVDQLYRRFYEPYLQFVYLRNAYHFYAPEPGPASIMVCLLKTEDGEEVTADGIRRAKYRTEWVVTPRRPQDVRDPLGVTYYRRLSLTDQISHRDTMTSEIFERSEVANRRRQLAIRGTEPYIPLHPNIADAEEYILPQPIVSRYYLPAYAEHLLMELPEADRKKTTVKIYRLEHRTLSVGSFVGFATPSRRPGDPYHPTTYLPFFLGEFKFVPDRNDPLHKPMKVELLDPKDPMLYWLVPIIGEVGGSASVDPNRKEYTDYLSVHAGQQFDWSTLR
jgi:hypothetical protein